VFNYPELELQIRLIIIVLFKCRFRNFVVAHKGARAQLILSLIPTLFGLSIISPDEIISGIQNLKKIAF